MASRSPVLPDWLRDVLLALGAFVGGRSINALTDAHKDRLQLRDSVTRLAIGVESISGDLQNIRGEISKQVGELKVEIHDQVSGLKNELHQQQVNHDRRMEGIEIRVDGVNQRIDALAASGDVFLSRPAHLADRRAWERGCPPKPPEEDGKP
jgi:hypothetical protein